MLRKNFALAIRTIFSDPEGSLFVLDMTYISSKTFRLMAVYALCRAG